MHYDDEGYSDVVADTLPALSDANRSGLEEGLYVDSLTATDLQDAGVEGADAAEIIGAMGSVLYEHTLEEVLPIVTHEHKDEIFENTLVYEVRETTDRDCFLARECPRLDQTIHETTKVAVLGEATRDVTLSFLWAYTEEGVPVVLIRALSPEPVEFSTNIAAVYQQYQIYAIYDDDGGSRRDEAFWADAEFIGIDVPKSFMVDTAVDEMADQAERVDEAI